MRFSDRFEGKRRLLGVRTALPNLPPLMFLRPHKSLLLLGAWMVLSSLCAPTEAQEPVAAEIRQLIRNLGSSDFQIRQAAVQSLKDTGDTAIEPLEIAQQSASILETF